MSTETMIQAAIVRVDMALCSIGRALVDNLPPILTVIGLYLLAWLVWRTLYDRHNSRRP